MADSTHLHVLYEDNHCLAVLKPAPLLTQGPPAVPSLEALVKAYLKDKYHKAGRVYLGVPHRLDRPVSGVILFARSSKAAERLSEQFRQRQVAKTYWGAVEGDLEAAEGIWTDWQRKIEDQARVESVPADTPGVQQAVLRYRKLQLCSGGALVEFVPETGRMHQIRLQAAIHGHPIRGDELYGARLPFGPPAELSRERVIALHARTLTFLHPIRYEPVTIVAPLPQSWDVLGIVPTDEAQQQCEDVHLE